MNIIIITILGTSEPIPNLFIPFLLWTVGEGKESF